jgi:hypothetical protein
MVLLKRMLFLIFFFYIIIKNENHCINRDINSNAIEHEPLIIPYFNFDLPSKKDFFFFFFFA